MAQGSAQCPVTGSSCFALSLARDSVNQHFSSTTKSELTSVFDSIGGLLVFFAGRFQKSPQTASLATEKAGQTKRRAVRNPPADLSENESSHIFFPRSQHTRESAVSPTESCAVGIRLARRRRPTRTALCSVFFCIPTKVKIGSLSKQRPEPKSGKTTCFVLGNREFTGPSRVYITKLVSFALP